MRLSLWVFGMVLCQSVASQAEQQSVSVSVSPFSQVLERVEDSAPATVISLHQTRLPAQLAAQVVTIRAKVGQKVDKDAVLVELDCRQVRARHDEAEAGVQANKPRLSLAAYQLARARALREKDHASELALRSRQSEHAMLQAQAQAYEAAWRVRRLDVGHCQIRAPYAGVVTARHTSVGDWVTPGTPVMALVDLDGLEVAAEVSTAQAAVLTDAKAMRFHAAGQDYPVALRAVVPVVKSRTRTQDVRLEFTGKKALAGQAGRLLWQSPQSVLPASLLVRRGDRLGVFLYRAGKAFFHVLADAEEGRPASIALADDEQVIIHGRYSLMHDQAVMIDPDTPLQSPTP